MEGAEHAVAAAHDQGALAGDVEGEVGAGLGQLAFVADQLPGAPEQELLLELEQLRVGVAPAREARGGPSPPGIDRSRGCMFMAPPPIFV